MDTKTNDERLDAACKSVLSQKAILAQIMKGCLSEYQDSTAEEIAEKYIEGQPQISAIPVMPDAQKNRRKKPPASNMPLISGMDTEDKSVDEGTVTYDIRFCAMTPESGEQIGLIINVEAQNPFRRVIRW